MKRTGLYTTLLLCVLLSFGIAAYADDVIQKSYTVEPGGKFFLDTDIGPIEVHSAAESRVSVDVVIEKRSMTGSALEFFNKEFDLNFEQQGNTVRVICERKGRSHHFWNNISRKIHVEFRVTLPEKFNAELGTSGGGITVSDLAGDVTAKTSGGGLHFGNIKGRLTGKTSGGGITLEGGEGEVDVHTSGGGIEIGKVRGNVKASTSGGGISVEEVMGNIDASTSGGPVNVTITRTPTADCKLTTSGGGITVRLTPDAAIHVDASTSGGHVSTDFPVLVKGKLDSRSLQADINGGGPLLFLRTSGGGISIRQIQ